MGAEQTHAYSPDYAVLPGDTLLEVMESLGITQAELAERTGRPTKTINEIVKGKAAITPETALQLERVLGAPAGFWNNLEQNFRTALARAADRERLEGQIKWLRGIPVRSLVQMKWVVFAAIGVILSACYLLWLYQRVFYGETADDLRSHMPDLSGREWAALIPLAVMMLWLGTGSETFLPRISEVTGPILNETTLNVPFRVSAPSRDRSITVAARIGFVTRRDI